MEKTIKQVGVIGLGTMGKPIAENLLKKGYTVAVYDVRDEPMNELGAVGAIRCSSPAEVASASDAIISIVLDRAQTEAVVLGPSGVNDAVRPRTLLIIGSTLGPEPVLKLAAAMAEKAVEIIDAPMSGGYVAARQGKLSLMIGADQQTLERGMPVLSAIAGEMTHAGAVGAGQTAKLAHNLVFALNVFSLLEGLSLGIAGGVDPSVLKQIFKQGTANSAVLQLWDELGPRWKNMLKRTDPQAPIPNIRKDLHLILELAQALGVPLYQGSQASLVGDAGVATGHADPRT